MSDIDKHELTSFHRADDHALAPRPDSCCECANQKIRALGSEKAALEADLAAACEAIRVHGRKEEPE